MPVTVVKNMTIMSKPWFVTDHHDNPLGCYASQYEARVARVDPLLFVEDREEGCTLMVQHAQDLWPEDWAVSQRLEASACN